MVKLHRKMAAFAALALTAATPVLAQRPVDELRVSQLEAEVRRLQQQVEAQARRIERLEQAWRDSGAAATDLAAEEAGLARVNQQLWVIEDEIRAEERARRFGDRFVELARAVYVVNDERAAIKKRINTALGSNIVEEKSYQQYRQRPA